METIMLTWKFIRPITLVRAPMFLVIILVFYSKEIIMMLAFIGWISTRRRWTHLAVLMTYSIPKFLSRSPSLKKNESWNNHYKFKISVSNSVTCIQIFSWFCFMWTYSCILYVLSLDFVKEEVWSYNFRLSISWMPQTHCLLQGLFKAITSGWNGYYF